MNEHQPDWAKPSFREMPKTIETAEDEQQALLSVRAIGRRMLPSVILSDFDGTLCDQYSTDTEAKTRMPELDPELTKLIRRNDIPLVIATARRWDNPALQVLRKKFVSSPWLPLIAENGGVTLEGPLGAPTINVDDKDVIWRLHHWADDAKNRFPLPTGKEIQVKHGETISVVRLRNTDGSFTVDDQDKLLDMLQGTRLPEDVQIVHGVDSLTIQPSAVDKAAAFRAFIKKIGVSRDDMCVLGIGDGPNDAAIFRESDLSIGVHPRVKDMVDIGLLRGVESTKLLFGTSFNRDLFPLAKKAEQWWEKDFRRRQELHNQSRPIHWRDVVYH